MTNQSSTQTDFFSNPQSNQDTKPEFAELCNALYERELLYLSQQGPKQISMMKRRLSGLSHHIKKAARYLSSMTAPIDIDHHNASWQAKQAAKNPARIHDQEKVYNWYEQHANHGLVVPVRVEQIDSEHIELDSIDRVNVENASLHLNKFGWFEFNGHALSPAKKKYSNFTLCKPTKSLMTAACCGHSWNHKGKVSPRRLTLREVLLSTTIDWRRFTNPKNNK